MPGIYTHGHSETPFKAEAFQDTSLIFESFDAKVHIAGLPAGVAKATADAFNAAMEAHNAPKLEAAE